MLPPPPPSAISETSTLRSHDSQVICPPMDQRKDVTPPMSVLALNTPANTSGPDNPWLVEGPGPTKITKRKNELVSGKCLARARKSENQMQKQLMKGPQERERAIDEATIELDINDILALGSSSKADLRATPKANGMLNGSCKKQQKKEAKRVKKEQKTRLQDKTPAHDDNDSSDTNSELEAQEARLRKGKKPSAFEQRDLVARAFAGDNVLQVCGTTFCRHTVINTHLAI